MLTIVHSPTQTGTVLMRRAALVDLLDRAKHVVPARLPKPIFAGVHLEATEGWLHVRATDGDLALFAQMPVEGELPACVVPFAELSRRVKASKHLGCSLALSDGGEQLRINGGQVDHALCTLPVDDFPPVSDMYVGQTVSLDAAELVAGLRVAGLATAKDAGRYAINGVLLESDDKGTRLVATDGRRLVIVGLQAVESEFTGRVILPARLVRLMEKLAEEQTDHLLLAVARQKAENGEEVPGQLFAAGPDWLLSTYEPEGSFPLYQDVTPRTHARFLIERAPLIELLSEVALATSDDSRMVRVDLDPQQVRLSAAAPGIGDSSAALPCQFLGGGDPVIHTAFNPAYLLDALKSLACASVVFDVDQNGYGCDHKVFGKPAILYAEHDPATRWIVMPVNAGLAATHENLGSNYPKGLEDAPDSATQSAH
jgi:DNA polymerase-3 subunit beta